MSTIGSGEGITGRPPGRGTRRRRGSGRSRRATTPPLSARLLSLDDGPATTMSARPSPSVSPARPRSPIAVALERARPAAGRRRPASWCGWPCGRSAGRPAAPSPSRRRRDSGSRPSGRPTPRSSTPSPFTSPRPAMREAQQAADAGNEPDRACCRARRGRPTVMAAPPRTTSTAPLSERPSPGANGVPIATSSKPSPSRSPAPATGLRSSFARPEDPHRPPRRRRREIDVGGRRRSEDDERPPAVAHGGGHDQVVEPVAVHVPGAVGAGDREGRSRCGRSAPRAPRGSPGRGWRSPRRRRRGRRRSAARPAAGSVSTQEVGDPVAVHVARGGHARSRRLAGDRAVDARAGRAQRGEVDVAEARLPEDHVGRAGAPPGRCCPPRARRPGCRPRRRR